MASKRNGFGRRRALAVAFALVAGGLLAASPPAAAAPTDSGDPVVVQPHGMRSATSVLSSEPIGALTARNNLIYHAPNPVMHSVKVFTIFWQPPGSTPFSPTYRSLINRFYGDIGGSDFYNINTQYYDTTGYPLNSVTLGGTWNDSTALPGGRGSYDNPLTQSDVAVEVLAAIAANPTWGPPGLDRLYYLYTPANVIDQYAKDNFFCAYHSYTADAQARRVVFAYGPEMLTNPAGCVSGTGPNGDASADMAISVSSHELFEAASDPLLNAWWDPATGNENADQCSWYFGTLAGDDSNITLGANKYKMQLEWSNVDSGQPPTREVGCVKSFPTSGLLRVTTSPAVPAQILVDGVVADSWGLTWLELAPGSHTVSFTHVEGFTEPVPQTVTVVAGATTTVNGVFTARGSLRVVTSPAVASQISVDGVPRNDWGLWTDFPTGSHQVCFGAVAGFTPPACQNVTVNAGALTTVTGTFTTNANAPGAPGVGLLRVTTSPAVPAQILVDGVVVDSWGLTWLELAPGSHTVSFTHVEGFTEPVPQTVTVVAGATTTVNGVFTARGSLRVVTSPAVGTRITVNGIPRNDWGMWTDLPTGTYTVCAGIDPNHVRIPPPCSVAVVSAGALTTVTATYT